MVLKKPLKRQAGLTFVESLLVLAVAAGIVALAYMGYKSAKSAITVESQARGVTQLAASISRTFGRSGSYSDVTTANVINARIVPDAFTVEGGEIRNKWNGLVTPAVGNQAGNTPASNFKITITNVPRSACFDFVTSIAQAATISLWVNNVEVKNLNGDLFPNLITTNCEAGPGNIILVAN